MWRCWFNGLNVAAYNGDLEEVKKIVLDGADVNGKGWDDDTPLANAIRGEHIELLFYYLIKEQI